MLKKLTGIFILLSFLLVKSTPLFAMDANKVQVTVDYADQHGTSDTSDSDKEVKQFETIDEDFLQGSIALPGFVTLTVTNMLFDDGHIATPYISLPYPPPNRLA